MNTVRRIREVAGLTQAELADLAGTSQPAIAAYESASKVPSLRTLSRLAASVGLDLDIRLVQALTREDRRSLVIHEKIAEQLRADPEATLATARSNLEQMRRLHPHALALFDQWERILEGSVDDLVEALTDPRSEYRDLRQVTPFAGVLDRSMRADAYRRFRTAEARR